MVNAVSSRPNQQSTTDQQLPIVETVTDTSSVEQAHELARRRIRHYQETIEANRNKPSEQKFFTEERVTLRDGGEIQSASTPEGRFYYLQNNDQWLFLERSTDEKLQTLLVTFSPNMGVAENEVDFPRGGTAVERTPKSTKSTEPISKGDGDQLFGVAKKRKSKGKQNESEEMPTKKKKLEAKAAVWSKPINMELLTDGVMGVGIVTEVHEDYVLMETADSCRVRLPATQISKKFTELLKLEKISLESAFVVGQMVPFRVTQRSTAPTKKGKGAVKDRKPSLPIVSCDPSKLYSHMSPAQLVPGLVLAGIVESVEEKGAVLDIGMQSTQAFLPVKKQQRPVEVGQPVVVRVEGGRTSRVVAVTSYVEQDNLSLEACESLNLNHLTPGTIIDCEPDAEPSITAGIYVTLGNGVRGFVAKSHLPPRLRGDITKLGRSLRCVVMFCQQNSPLLVLSAHPDIVAISKPEKRASFLGYSIGDRVKCKVIDIVPSSFLVCFSLPAAEDGKTPLVSAISYKKYLKKPEELETLYSIGSEHMCRVMGFRYVDRCLVVSTRKDLLNQKFVTYKDATPGELVEAKVTDVHPRGVQVAVNDFVKGFIPLDQLADKKVAQEKVFIVGKPVKCRVLFINEVKRQVWLTARPSLVNYKGTLLTSYDSKNEGVTTIGYVVKILETGGAVLQFFGSVRGLLLANEVKRIGGEVKPGQIVEVRVMSVNETDNRMTLAVADESAASTGRVVNPKASDLNPEQCGTVAVVDEVSESGVGGRKSEKALVHLESNPSIKGCILPNLVSDSLDSPLESLRNTLRCGMKLDPVSLLGSLGGVNRFTTKRFVHDWIHTFQKGVPKSFEDLKMGQMVCGVISQRVVDECVYVEIVGGCGLVGKAALEDIEGGKDGIDCLQIGQTVIGRIRKVNAEKNTFRISLKIYNCVPEKQLSTKAPSSVASLALQLLRSSVEEIAVFAESAKLPAPESLRLSTSTFHVHDCFRVEIIGELVAWCRTRHGVSTKFVPVRVQLHREPRSTAQCG
ncbi:unnamed protein product [Nippostrongylus brasiliensis]|uniref:Protein RRP5 homolog (inferred by orthology to a human protein) n=1 Tax=Nippostrongylus brasiliensis TaxID=27835 RepID=A0A0N4XXD0_NIPBR|nr:unnamed protein product [Nippostrongylus brasiliensis]